jgi:hypothetical protein
VASEVRQIVARHDDASWQKAVPVTDTFTLHRNVVLSRDRIDLGRGRAQCFRVVAVHVGDLDQGLADAAFEAEATGERVDGGVMRVEGTDELRHHAQDRALA